MMKLLPFHNLIKFPIKFIMELGVSKIYAQDNVGKEYRKFWIEETSG